jgi:glycosyltransferase involved in cell wall biosynthesis
MRVLLLTNVLPANMRGGGEIVTQSVVEALDRAGHEVRVLGYRRPGSAPEVGPHEECAQVRPIETSGARSRALGWMARALATGTPYTSAKYYSRAYVQAAERALAAHPDAVILDHAHMLFALERASRPLPPLVFLTHNAEGKMYAENAAAARPGLARWANARESRKIGGFESALASRSRQTWVLTEADARYVRELCPGADVRTLEVASMIAPAADPAPEPACDVALIGSWTWRPNGLGLEWFADEVVPRLPPGMTVEVAGGGAEWLRGRHRNVTVRGFVPDARAFMRRARVVAVPSVAGGGVQVKTLDAVACGVPVVATSVAARGLRGLPDSVAIADEPARFAEELAAFAAAPAPDRLRHEAVEWSRARRRSLEESVVAWLGELVRTGDRPERAHAEATAALPPA